MRNAPEHRMVAGLVSKLTRRRALQIGSLGVLSNALPDSALATSIDLGFEKAIGRARIAVSEAMVAADAPAATIALTSRNQLIWSEAFGVIDKASGIRAQEATLFCIGSCSKVIAAAAVMILVDQGVVDLDAPIIRYLPDFEMLSPDYKQITVRMLLNHASGFAGTNYRNAFTSEAHASYQAETVDALKLQRLKHKPGEFSVYCNDGFTVAEWLIERVTALPYTAFIEKELLRPLGMMASRYATESFPAGSYAPAHREGMKQPLEFVNFHATGGLYSTPTEMSSFLRMLLNNGLHEGRRVLSSTSVAEMAENQTLRASFRPVEMTDGYGLGWDGVEHGGFATSGITAWHKSGGTSVYSSFMIVLPDEGLAVITSGSSTAYNAASIAELVLNEALLESGRLKASPSPMDSNTAMTTDVHDLDAMPGIYANYAGLARIIKDPAGSLIMSDLTNGDWSGGTATLQPRPGGTYGISDDPSTSFLPLEAEGQSYLVARTPYGLGTGIISVPYFQKMEPRNALSAAWKQRLDQRWLLVNEAPSSLLWGLLPPTLTLGEAPGLLGYVLVNSAASHTNNQIANASESDDIAKMCLRIPVANSRDLNDLEVIPVDDGEWIRLGSYVFQPESTVPSLTTGSSTHMNEPNGYGAWLKIVDSEHRNLRINGATAWKLFDGNLALLEKSNSIRTTDFPMLGRGVHYLLTWGNPGSITRVEI